MDTLTHFPKKILGKYQIKYDCGIKQEKYLISQEDYNNIYKPYMAKIDKLYKTPEKGDKKLSKKEIEAKENKIKKTIKELFGQDWFISKSPLGEAIESKFLMLPEQQGGIIPIKITKL